VLAEPAAERLAAALAGKLGCRPEVHKRPAQIGGLLADLRTYSLFAGAKVTVVVESAVLADATAAASLLEEAATALPVDPANEPGPRERNAALRLFQVLRLFQIDPYDGSPESCLRELPEWAFQGPGAGSRRRAMGRSKVERLREELGALLELGRAAQLQGWAESDVEELGAVVRGGLPPGHVLVLAESSVVAAHPILEALRGRDAVAEVGSVELDRGDWQGLAEIAFELERTTGASITRGALEELARRTLRPDKAASFRGGAAEAESTARFAAEFRKLAMTARDGRIDEELVESGVEDRGQEDVWGILDELGAGHAAEALRRLDRLLESADDPVGERLAFFGLLAGFGRQLTAIGGRLEEGGLPGGERHYGRFKERLAPKLQAELSGGRSNPLAGLHPYRLHRAYLAASAMPKERLATLPARILETELALKGESRSPQAALTTLVCEIAARPTP
jgi:hypothetical protein